MFLSASASEQMEFVVLEINGIDEDRVFFLLMLSFILLEYWRLGEFGIEQTRIICFVFLMSMNLYGVCSNAADATSIYLLSLFERYLKFFSISTYSLFHYYDNSGVHLITRVRPNGETCLDCKPAL